MFELRPGSELSAGNFTVQNMRNKHYWKKSSFGKDDPQYVSFTARRKDRFRIDFRALYYPTNFFHVWIYERVTKEISCPPSVPSGDGVGDVLILSL